MDIEKLFYKIGKVFLVIGIIGAVVLLVTDFQIISWLPECYYFSRTGLYCPGCGGTRSVKRLLRGDLIGNPGRTRADLRVPSSRSLPEVRVLRKVFGRVG